MILKQVYCAVLYSFRKKYVMKHKIGLDWDIDQASLTSLFDIACFVFYRMRLVEWIYFK